MTATPTQGHTLLQHPSRGHITQPVLSQPHRPAVPLSHSHTVPQRCSATATNLQQSRPLVALDSHEHTLQNHAPSKSHPDSSAPSLKQAHFQPSFLASHSSLAPPSHNPAFLDISLDVSLVGIRPASLSFPTLQWRRQNTVSRYCWRRR